MTDKPPLSIKINRSVSGQQKYDGQVVRDGIQY